MELIVMRGDLADVGLDIGVDATRCPAEGTE
jgi:hypothetical protein